jgi:hypothetical protein
MPLFYVCQPNVIPVHLGKVSQGPTAAFRMSSFQVGGLENTTHIDVQGPAPSLLMLICREKTFEDLDYYHARH